MWLDSIVGSYVQKRVVAVSEDLKLKLARRFPLSHIDVIENGIDVSAIESVAACNLGMGTINVGIVGRLTPVKRVDLFIEMAKRILESKTDLAIEFYVIGDGPLGEELKNQAVDAKQNIHFVGHVQSAVPYIKSLDFLIMCSDHEGTPMTLLEAMCCKVPIIAHDVGGLRELLSGGDCGALVQDHSAEGYEKALLACLAHQEATRLSTACAYDRVQERYSASRNAILFKALYREVCEVG